MNDPEYTHTLMVWCRRNGVSRDAGQHDQGEFSSNEEAIAYLLKSANGLLRYYDEVGVTIRHHDEIIYQTTLRPKGNATCDCFGWKIPMHCG